MDKPTNLTYEQFENDLKRAMFNFADMLNTVFDAGAAECLLGMDSTEQGAADIDLGKLGAGCEARTLYEYSLNARIASNATNYIDMLTGPEQLLLMLESQPVLLPQSVEYVIRTSVARWKIDDDDENYPLTLQEIALLANMDIRSVRNAASAKSDPLKTYNESGRTFIAKDDAIAWLKSRRGFKPTVVFNPGSDDIDVPTFLSQKTVGDFVKKRRKEMKLGPKELCGRTEEQNSLDEETLNQVESGKLSFSPSTWLTLANALGVNGEAFAYNVLKAIQREELEQVRAAIMTKHKKL